MARSACVQSSSQVSAGEQRRGCGQARKYFDVAAWRLVLSQRRILTRMKAMAATLDPHAGDLSPDPFLERTPERCSMDVHVLGGHFHVSSDSRALLDVVAMAYAGLPPHALPVSAPRFHIHLRLVPGVGTAAEVPPPVQLQSGAGFLCGGSPA